jgi:hypothetical protein
MEHTKHIFRIFILAVFVFVAVLVGRMFYVPESWGIFGNYRANVLVEATGHHLVHGGTSSCIPCHEDKGKKHDEGVHKTIPCEDCHEPLTLHVAEGKKIKDMPVYRGTEQCLICHQGWMPVHRNFRKLRK